MNELAPHEAWRRASTQKALRSYFVDRISKGTAKGRDGLNPQTFKSNFPAEIKQIHKDLKNAKYHFSPYMLTLRLKGRGKIPREISIPTVRDRIALRALAVALNKIVPACSMEMPQSMISRIIKTLEENQFTHFVKLDVKEFYPSINHTWLEEVLTKRVRTRGLRTLLLAAAKTPSVAASQSSKGAVNNVGVPQGLSVSNGLAELSMLDLDEAMNGASDLAYFRYVDDILIFTKSDRAKETIDLVGEHLKFAGLKVHDADTSNASKRSVGIIRDEFDFLGYRFHWPRVSVRAGSVGKLENRIARVFTRYKYVLQRHSSSASWRTECRKRLEWHLNLIVSGCVLDGKRLGWIAYFSQVRHHQLLMHLDSIVARQMSRNVIHEFQPKTFVQAYRFAAAKTPDATGFVPNFDKMDLIEKRKLLVEVFAFKETAIQGFDDTEIERLFLSKIRKVTRDLERDLRDIS